MTRVGKNQHIGICLYLQTYIELSMYRVSETCKLLSNVYELLLSGNCFQTIPRLNISSLPSMVHQLYELMLTVSSSLTVLSKSSHRLSKKFGYLLPLFLMHQHLLKISALIFRYVAILDELQTMSQNIVASPVNLRTRTLSWGSLLNALDLSVKDLDSDISLIYRNVLNLYTQSMDSLIMNNFPNLERHITQIQRSLYPSLKNHI